MLLLAGAKSVSSDSDACLACCAFAHVFFSKPCFSSSVYSLIPRPFQHVQEGQGMRLECICDFLYHCPGSPQGWGRNCETNALSIPAVVPRRGGGGGISLIGALYKWRGELESGNGLVPNLQIPDPNISRSGLLTWL